MYIGQMGRCLKQHLSEHCRALRKGDTQASALAEHVFATEHAVDLSQSDAAVRCFGLTICMRVQYQVSHFNTLILCLCLFC